MPDNPEKSANLRPEKDRRRHVRQRIHSLSYVKMGDSNGGIVLNLSESGISVQAAAVLDPTEPVTMWLEIPKVRERVEVTGEIAWLSPSKKEAGLRFVDLPESTLQQIRKWIAREAAPEQFEDETEPLGDEQDVPGEPVEVAHADEADVRELTEASIMSAEEIKSLESARPAVELQEMEETEEEEAEEEGVEDEASPEVESEAAETAEIDVDAKDDFEDGEDFDEESESESEPDAETEEEVELVAKASVEEKRETEVEIREESEGGESLEDEPATEVTAEAKAKDDSTDDAKGDVEDGAEAEEESQTEDELIQAFGPPVVPFERRPHAPFSSMNALAGGSRGAQNLAVAASVPREVQMPVVQTAPQPDITADSGWNVFTVQLQTGWFLAALVLLLALISFIAGMAVRRGALNNVLGEQQDALTPKSSGVSAAGGHAGLSSGGAADGTNSAAAKPLSIEIVDSSNHQWVIPASSGTNHVSAAAAPDTTGNVAANPAAGRAKGAEVDQQAQGSSGPAPGVNADGAGPANAGKPVVPLVLSLPETPVSASGSVAISSQRSVPVPADGSKAAQNAKNLQVGQLINLVEPVYPVEAVQQKVEGTVKLHAVIGTDGVIESVAQVSGPQMLVNASIIAVRNWKYSPTRMNGQAIETQEDISFVFRLPN